VVPLDVLVADPGIDDAVALAVLAGLGVPPALVVAVAGNSAGVTAARNAAGLVTLLGLDAAVRTWNADAPAFTKPGRRAAHGDDGLGGQQHRLPEVEWPAPLHPGLPVGAGVLATGPLGAVAALVAGRDRPTRVLWMGGALGAGNITPDAEFNAWCAPRAVNAVVRACPGVEIVPLDVTAQIVLTDDDLRTIDRGAVGSLLADALRSRAVAVVHDAVAAVAWVRPDLFHWEHLAVRCDDSDAGRGRMVVDGPGPTPVATDVHADAVRSLVVGGVVACG
jgi:pyrimidine-specific ribonucleoside hydrolase